ncbi:MAG: hypothetical protein H6558_15945 [Lewinellaceae bacterium]|nr:hypothetical protein [Lewinellaceae bacterium]
MRDYISSILPRIQQYSKQLNDEANFVEIPWGFIDDDGDKVTYIFRRNNELLVSKQGEVATGRWEYLRVVQSMLIEYNGAKRMYNQGFLDKAVMVLRKDGTEEVFALANSQIIHDLRIDGYLKKVVEQGALNPPGDNQPHRKPQIHRYLPDGQKIVFWGKPGTQGVLIGKGTRVTLGDSNMLLGDGKYNLQDGSNLHMSGGVVEHFEPKYVSLTDIIVGVIIGVFFLLLIAFLANS